MSKEQISGAYLETAKEQYLHNDRLPSAAIVVGSNKTTNIGAAIARQLRKTIDSVEEYDRSNWVPEMIDDKLTILILANGSTHIDWIEDQPINDIGEVLHDNLYTSIVATRQFVRTTINTRTPKYIIYIGSMAYRNVLNGSSVYCAAKAGLAHFSKCMAWELAPKNYNVFCVHPSNTEGTPMTEETIVQLMRYRSIPRKSAEGYWGSNLPRRKWLQPDDIANVVEFLVSGKADYMSGAQIDLAGGQR